MPRAGAWCLNGCGTEQGRKTGGARVVTCPTNIFRFLMKFWVLLFLSLKIGVKVQKLCLGAETGDLAPPKFRKFSPPASHKHFNSLSAFYQIWIYIMILKRSFWSLLLLQTEKVPVSPISLCLWNKRLW